MKIELVSPESHVFSGDAKMVVARTTEGDIAFEPQHIPFVGVLLPGQVKVVFADDQTQLIAVHSGFVEVSEDSVSILSDVAELSQDIDVARAEAAEQRASQTLSENPDSAEAAAALRRAQVRLQVATS